MHRLCALAAMHFIIFKQADVILRNSQNLSISLNNMITSGEFCLQLDCKRQKVTRFRQFVSRLNIENSTHRVHQIMSQTKQSLQQGNCVSKDRQRSIQTPRQKSKTNYFYCNCCNFFWLLLLHLSCVFFISARRTESACDR